MAAYFTRVYSAVPVLSAPIAISNVSTLLLPMSDLLAHLSAFQLCVTDA